MYNTEDVTLLFLFPHKIWNASFGKRKQEILTPKIQTVQKILGHKQIFPQLELGPNNGVFWTNSGSRIDFLPTRIRP